MAARGYIELLRLSKRGHKSYVDSETEKNRWSGVVFELSGQYFVAPIGEVAEVIYLPVTTPVPNVKPWVWGMSNVRGRLYSVIDLQHFLSGKKSEPSTRQKLICVSNGQSHVGLVVDQVLGVQHFNKKNYFLNNDTLPAELQHYCQGYFYQHHQAWNIFLFSQLLGDTNFINAAA